MCLSRQNVQPHLCCLVMSSCIVVRPGEAGAGAWLLGEMHATCRCLAYYGIGIWTLLGFSWLSKCLQHIELCCKKIPRSLPTRVGSYSMWRLNGLKMLYKDFTPTNNALNDENVQASWCLSSIFEAAWTKIHFWPGLPDKGNTLQQRQQSNAMDINDPTQRPIRITVLSTSGLSSLAKQTLRCI